MSLNNFFDHIYCINLKRRIDRWEECKEEFDKHQLKVERFEAVDGKSYDWSDYTTIFPFGKGHDLESGKISKSIAGLAKTHQLILQDAIDNKYESILILEDDVVFDDLLNYKFPLLTKELPADWSLLYLGTQNFTDYPTKITNRLGKPNESLGLHAIGIRSTVYKDLLESIDFKYPIDVNYMEKAKSMNSFVALEQLAWQRPSYSDLIEIFVSYGRHTTPTPMDDDD
jgi:hypothetical protein